MAIVAGAALIVALAAGLVLRGPGATSAATEPPATVLASGGSARAYDFRDASQLGDWHLLPRRAARARAPYLMDLASGSAFVSNGEAVFSAAFRSDARIAATVWLDASDDSPSFGLFAGSVAWAVASRDRTVLLPRRGGPPIRSKSSTGTSRGARLRAAMSTAGGRAICTLDGEVVFDEPIQEEGPVEVGLFAFHDARMGFDDVLVGGTPIR